MEKWNNSIEENYLTAMYVKLKLVKNKKTLILNCRVSGSI